MITEKEISANTAIIPSILERLEKEIIRLNESSYRLERSIDKIKPSREPVEVSEPSNGDTASFVDILELRLNQLRNVNTRLYNNCNWIEEITG